MKRSAPRKEDLVWSARVTIEQDVTLQSISPICELIESVTEKVPPFLNGIASSDP
jgi:hypothetical protein